jgi:hypothetical protein
MDNGTNKIRQRQVLEILAAEFSDPNPTVIVVEQNVGKKQIDDL